MKPGRFDGLTKSVARRSLLAGGLGLASSVVVSRAAAQDATPEASPEPQDEEVTEIPFLFVQTFDGGTWEPKQGEVDVYTLTLTGASANTSYFSDRPERIVGLAPTQQFLDGLGFTPSNPPNAAIIAQRADGTSQELLVIELMNPVYDPENETLTYDAMVLADQGEHPFTLPESDVQDYELGELFGPGSLFIDDCNSGEANCYYRDVDGKRQKAGRISIGCCWDWSGIACTPCNTNGSSEYYVDKCFRNYPDKCAGGACWATDRSCWSGR